MKHFFTIIFCFFSLISFSQMVKFSDLAVTKKGKYQSYQASDGAVYNVGDRIKLGVPSSNKTFAFIYFGDGILVANQPLDALASGQETEIKNIYVQGNKRSGYYVLMHTKGIVGALPVPYYIQFENALGSGEIRGVGMTSDEALVELKKAKDKLDLGLITQEEFDKIKLELSKFIK